MRGVWMNSWRDEILKTITPLDSPIIIASDPDDLLRDEIINRILRDRGYEILFYEDSIKFRYLFETRYREQLKQNVLKLILAVDVSENQLRDILPYDILKKSRIAALSLAKIFPKLNYPIITEINTTELERLYQAYKSYRGEKLGERETYQYVLRVVYQIDPESILNQEDLLQNILEQKNRKITIPPKFLTYLKEQISNKILEIENYEKLLDEEKLYKYIQESWNNVVKNWIKQEKIDYQIFDNAKIRPYIINSFLENVLKPVPVENVNIYPRWMHPGLEDSTALSIISKIVQLLDRLEILLKSTNFDHRDWQQIASIWAETIVNKINIEDNINENLKIRITETQNSIDKQFTTWILENYKSLYSLRLREPVYVSHVLDHLARTIKEKKVALLVIDGMSIDQYITLREGIEKQKPGKYNFKYNAIYSALPTITSVSRQALFSGMPPALFEESLLTTNREERGWVRYWEDYGINAVYKTGLILQKVNEIEDLQSLFSEKIVGIVINFLDKTMHGETLGTWGVHQSITKWLEAGVFIDLIDNLFNNGFEIYLTSDHGNTEAEGIGDLREGCLPISRGSRVRIYEKKIFAEKALEKFPEAIIMPETDTESKLYYLYAPDRKAFSNDKIMRVTHGGISIEEVIVPFVRIVQSL